MNELATITDTQRDLIARTIAGPTNLSQDEFDLFLYSCQHLGLDPLAKQVYAMKSGGRMSIITSIDGFRAIASRTGKYAGQAGPEWRVDGEWTDEPHPNHTAARVGVYVKGCEHPVWGVASRAEFNSGSGTWEKMPAHMLAKVAESHALRKAFPEEMSGAYTDTEMEGAGVTQDRPAFNGNTANGSRPMSPKAQLRADIMEWAGITSADEGTHATVDLINKACGKSKITDDEASQLALVVSMCRNLDGLTYDEVMADGYQLSLDKAGGASSTTTPQGDATDGDAKASDG